MSPVAVERPPKLVSEPLQPLLSSAADISEANTLKGGASEENIAHPPSLMPQPIPGVEASSSTSPRPSVAIAQAKQAQDSPRLPKRAPQLALKALATPPTEEPPEHARFTPAGEEGTPSKGIRGKLRLHKAHFRKPYVRRLFDIGEAFMARKSKFKLVQ